MMIPFTIEDLEKLPQVEYPGEEGTSSWRTWQLGDLRIRIVDYNPGYLADHWCRKGHIVYCIEGSFDTIMEGGETIHMSKGMCYVVSDGLSSHKSRSESGVKLLIIDGGFLGDAGREPVAGNETSVTVVG